MDCPPSTSTYIPIDTSMDSQSSTLRYDSSNSAQRKLTDFGQDVTNIKLGDIVWCKIFNFPFWPALVCIDPVDNTYIKEQDNKYKIHVRFLNDNCLRNWSKNIEPFISVDELICKYPKCLVQLKTNKRNKHLWDGAVQEAYDLIALTIEERKVHFAELYQIEYMALFDDSPNPSAAPENIENPVCETPKKKTSKERRLELNDLKSAIFNTFLEWCGASQSVIDHEKMIEDIINRYGIVDKKDMEVSDEEEFNERFNRLILNPTHPECKLSLKHKRQIESLANREEVHVVRRLVGRKMYKNQNDAKRDIKKQKK
ncbi:PWWP domain [Cinara cedri]|uniref:PWWP domain n=1 Tax=Cinara cedri TaxID=506608 RepID=A0A5E4NSG4_9HEMI|nr:PWWP domain [Cinara cedri]